jgi:chromosome segregation ATPase
VTLTDLMPIRIGVRQRPARKPRHRAIDEVERQQFLRAGADLYIKGLLIQLADVEADRDDARAKQAEAELTVVQQQADIDDLAAERDCLAEELAALKQRFAAELAAEANEKAVSVPCGYRDTEAIEDQATGPIDVRALWEARDAGLLGPVLDPGQVTTR